VNSGALEGQTISGTRRVKNPMHSHIVTSKWNRIELGFRSTYFQDMILLKSLYAFFLFESFEKTSLIINNTRFFSFIHGLQIFNPKALRNNIKIRLYHKFELSTYPQNRDDVLRFHHIVLSSIKTCVWSNK
jgi:hypothetical protein